MKKKLLTDNKTWVEINSAAVQYNFNVAHKAVKKNINVIAVVKSNAYGHGIHEIATVLSADKTFKKIGWFGVDSVDEAMIIRKINKKNPILVLGYIPQIYYKDCINHNISMVVYDRMVLASLALIAKKMKKKARIHIKIETGTYRQGILHKDLKYFCKSIARYMQNIDIEGMYTHFADTEDLSSLYYKEQYKNFEQGISLCREEGVHPAFIHASASAATLAYPTLHYQMVRWGIGLYGMYPSEDIPIHYKQYKLKPVLAWKTRIVQIKEVPQGGTVGYSRTFTAFAPMKIAVLPVGYWDGYVRNLSNKGRVLIRGKYAPIVGNICMNMCMVDITHIPRVSVADEVVLIGSQVSQTISAEELAKTSGTINYEVTTRINPLIIRIVV